MTVSLIDDEQRVFRSRRWCIDQIFIQKQTGEKKGRVCVVLYGSGVLCVEPKEDLKVMVGCFVEVCRRSLVIANKSMLMALG